MEEEFIKKQKKFNRRFHMAVWLCIPFWGLAILIWNSVGFDFLRNHHDNVESINFSLNLTPEQIIQANGKPDYIFQHDEPVSNGSYSTLKREFPGLVFCYEYFVDLHVIYFDEEGKSMCIQLHGT